MPSTVKTNATEWAPSTDIYSMVELVEKTKQRFIGEEDETTLATGIFGFMGDTEAKKIQSAVIMTGELGNEMFPQRAKLDKNVLTHAIYVNVEHINAVPAHMIINMAIKEDDLTNYMENDEFIISHLSSIQVTSDEGESFPFHLDYDIVLRRYKRTGSDKWSYTAWYDMDEKNIISDITMPYLTQPYIMNFNNFRYVFLQALVRQVDITELTDTMVSSSVIDNKSFTFTFEDQLVDFDVYVTERGKTTRLRAYFYGDNIDAGVTDYCWYLYINEDTIRVGFDQKSYMPGITAEIRVVVYTTYGLHGNFNYNVSEDEAGFYSDFEVPNYNTRIQCIVSCATESTDGMDRKSIEELRNLVPKMAMSRGYITTETDLYNYFNLISSDTNRLALSKKMDNNLGQGSTRLWYCYFVLKDEIQNVIPTNTLPIQIDLDDPCVFKCEGIEHERYIIPCGTTFVYNPEVENCRYIPEEEIPEKFSEEYFSDLYYYRTIYNIIINIDPLYTAYYRTLTNYDSFFIYTWLNDAVDVGFIANGYHMERYLLSKKDEYRIQFGIMQSINEDYHLYYKQTNEETGEEEIVNNLRVVLVICNGSEPYRYEDAEITLDDETGTTGSYRFKCEVTLHSDNNFDMENRIKLLDMYEAGYNTRNYGYFDYVPKAYIYIYGKLEDGVFGRNGKDNLIPGMEEYTLLNIYECWNGLKLFENYTDIVNTRIRRKISPDKKHINFKISGIPMIGEHYFTSEEHVTYLMKEIDIKKAYIDYCMIVLENTLGIDFKFFNTYGESKTFHMADKDKEGLGHIDIELRFRLKLINQSDTKTKQEIIDYVKEYIEDLNGLEITEYQELHFPNLLHDVKEEFGESIVYFEYMNYNRNRLGINHIELRKDIEDIHIPREFINVRNTLDEDGNLVPCIDVELVED